MTPAAPDDGKQAGLVCFGILLVVGFLGGLLEVLEGAPSGGGIFWIIAGLVAAVWWTVSRSKRTKRLEIDRKEADRVHAERQFEKLLWNRYLRDPMKHPGWTPDQIPDRDRVLQEVPEAARHQALIEIVLSRIRRRGQELIELAAEERSKEEAYRAFAESLASIEGGLDDQLAWAHSRADLSQDAAESLTVRFLKEERGFANTEADEYLKQWRRRDEAKRLMKNVETGGYHDVIGRFVRTHEHGLLDIWTEQEALRNVQNTSPLDTYSNVLEKIASRDDLHLDLITYLRRTSTRLRDFTENLRNPPAHQIVDIMRGAESTKEMVEKLDESIADRERLLEEVENLEAYLQMKGCQLTRPQLDMVLRQLSHQDLLGSLDAALIQGTSSDVQERAAVFIERFGEHSADHVWLFSLWCSTNGSRMSLDHADRLLNQAKKRLDLENWGSTLGSSGHSVLETVAAMSGLEFEKYLARNFERRGYKVEMTKASGDQGADLVLTKFGIRTVVQAKRYSAPVGNDAVQAVVAAKAQYRAQRAMIVTNSSFTKSAKALARSNDVQLVDGDALERQFKRE